MKLLARPVFLALPILVVLGSACLLSSLCNAQTATAQRESPSTKEVLAVFRALPGDPEDWLYPNSTAQTIAIQLASSTGTARTQTVALETKDSLKAVTKYYSGIVAKSQARHVKTGWRDSRWLVQFEGGSVMAGTENHKTFIVIVVMEPTVA